MLAHIQAFAQKLREGGVPVSNHEMLVTAQMLGHIDFADRESFKAALAATMCRSPSHLDVFSTLFDIFFSPDDSGLGDAISRAQGRDFTELDDEEMYQLVLQAMREGRDGDLRYMSRAVLDRLSSNASGGFLLYRALRFVDVDRLLGDLGADQDAVEWDDRLRRLEADSRIKRLREILEQEVRRRMAAERGAGDVADRMLRAPIDDRDFAAITSEEIADVKRTVIALARRLATRLQKLRQRGARGRLDMRKTFRKSLSTGGAMLDPQFKRRSPSRPDVVLICDVSGSVAAFTRFTLLLVACLQVQFPRVRSFLFVDTVDEVTEIMKAEDPVDAVPKALRTADVVWLDGHSDYGHTLKQFHSRYMDAIDERTQVIILGDARSNYRDPEAWVLKEIQEKAKKVWWLNPEPRHHWDSGDSVISKYSPHCDGVHEVRNMRQLAHFVERIA